MTHIQLQNCNNKNSKYTPVTQSILCFSNSSDQHHVNYTEQESEKKLVVYDSDITVTLKQGQGHKTWYELLDSKPVYIITQSLKDLPKTVSAKKTTVKSFGQIPKHVNYLP